MYTSKVEPKLLMYNFVHTKRNKNEKTFPLYLNAPSILWNSPMRRDNLCPPLSPMTNMYLRKKLSIFLLIKIFLQELSILCLSCCPTKNKKSPFQAGGFKMLSLICLLMNNLHRYNFSKISSWSYSLYKHLRKLFCWFNIWLFEQ